MQARLLLVLMFALIFLTGRCQAEKNGVLLIIDGLGSSYVFPGRVPSCVDGTLLPGGDARIFEGAYGIYELRVPVPETESGHAVIATGYSGATDEMLSYYDATLFDVLRDEGYLCVAILEKGDSETFIALQDIAACERNNSALHPAISLTVNSAMVPSGVPGILDSGRLEAVRPGIDSALAYRRYNEWAIDKAVEVVRFMNQTCPGQKYLLTVNAGGVDSAGHAGGYLSYCRAIADLSAGISSLARACEESGTILVVTADHGMSFTTAASRGSHVSGEAASRDESRLVPLAIYAPGSRNGTGIYGQECLAPTLLALMGCADLLSMRDGEPIPVNVRPAIYLVARKPISANVEGPGLKEEVLVNGTWRLGPLVEGQYTVHAGPGARVIDLRHDETVELFDRGTGGSLAQPWAPYMAAAALSVAGVVAALRLVQRR